MTIAARYDVIRPLGRGAMGDVHLGYDRMLGRAVAIKVMRREYAQDLEFAHRFLREARLAARLRHPSIVAIHDFGQDADGACYLVLEHVPGQTLEDVLAAGPLADGPLLALLGALADGLAHAHAAGVLHRDLKPANVLCEHGRADLPRIADFGLGKVIADGHITIQLTRRGAILGTPAYMAPEQASGEALDFAADVYAWGCIAYHALVGRPPFTGSAGEVLRAQIATPVPPIARSSPLVPVVMAALEKDPARRTRSGAELARALDAVRSHHHRDADAEAAAAAIVAVHAAPELAAAWARVVALEDRVAAAQREHERIRKLADVVAALDGQRRRLAAAPGDAASATMPSGALTTSLDAELDVLQRALADARSSAAGGGAADRAALDAARAELARLLAGWRA